MFEIKQELGKKKNKKKLNSKIKQFIKIHLELKNYLILL